MKAFLRATLAEAVGMESAPRRAERGLAEALAHELAADGWVVDEIAAVENGWNLSVENIRFRLWLELRPDPERTGGVRVRIEPGGTEVRRLFRRIDTTEVTSRLASSLEAAAGRMQELTDAAWIPERPGGSGASP